MGEEKILLGLLQDIVVRWAGGSGRGRKKRRMLGGKEGEGGGNRGEILDEGIWNMSVEIKKNLIRGIFRLWTK